MVVPTFSAVLLAGGQSIRMGRDKALLSMPGSDLLLWQRQWRTLQELHPVEIFWSGAARSGLPRDMRIVPDAVPFAGPLGGLSACLDILRTDLLVVLAIDLPQMSPAFLSHLLAQCSTGCGVVARHEKYFEPLAAVYPQALNILAARHLSEGRHAMQDLIGEAIQQGLLREIPLEEKDAALFNNINNPLDLAGLASRVQGSRRWP